MPPFLKLTNTDPFAAWFVVTGDATPDGIRVAFSPRVRPTSSSLSEQELELSVFNSVLIFELIVFNSVLIVFPAALKVFHCVTFSPRVRSASSSLVTRENVRV